MTDQVERKKQFFKKGYDYMSKLPFYISSDDLSDEQIYRLSESKNFCILPWTHMHAFPDGRTYPCCLADYWHPVGDLRKNTMEEVWNQDKFKDMRKNMLADKPCTECKKCYEQEESGFFSMRNESNRNLGHYINDVDKTLDDGTHPEFKIRYWDIRFSNLCNFSCRTCGPIFSSNWYNDHVKLYNRVPDVLGRDMARVEYTAGDENSIMEQMEPHIPHLEQVYFAGGEPLIMKEHYFLLDKLLERDKTNTRLIYNTNFSELRFKDKHVFDYWKKFETVNVGASLDGSYARGELIRKGTDWKQTLENRQRMKEEVPHVDFYISATVSVMNVLHVLDFHKEWVELGLIEPKDFNINILQGPDWYRVDILPEWFKHEVVIPAYKKHIEWLDPLDKLRRATVGFESVINFMSNPGNKEDWNKFIKETHVLDNLRKEKFWDIFPELVPAKNDRV